MSEVKKQSRGIGLPARAAAVAAAMVQAIVAAAISRLGIVASGRLTAEEAGELARSVAAACKAAFTASGSSPRRERSGELDGKAVCVKLSPRLERAVSREASNAGVSVPCWLRWAASEQLRLARSPLEPGEQERMATTDSVQKCDGSHISSQQKITESRFWGRFSRPLPYIYTI